MFPVLVNDRTGIHPLDSLPGCQTRVMTEDLVPADSTASLAASKQMAGTTVLAAVS
ncbi:MAG: hypothetical protein MK108_15270 [Mariniblastus sp.]|nr:hypothetical protein [Mariniblastus sp.]